MGIGEAQDSLEEMERRLSSKKNRRNTGSNRQNPSWEENEPKEADLGVEKPPWKEQEIEGAKEENEPSWQGRENSAYEQGAAGEGAAQNSYSQKYPTGIADLDSFLGGGIAANSNILLYGEPMCGKKILLMQFIFEGLKSQNPSILLLTDFGYIEWKLKMQNMGMDLAPFENGGLLHVIDCYSKQFEPSLQNSGNIYYVESPSALSAISLALSKVHEKIMQTGKTHRLGLHSLSSLLEESDEETFYKFLHFMAGKLRKNGATALYALEKGMHSQKQVAMIEHLMNGVIEFENGKIRQKGFGQNSAERDYSITDNGIQIR